MPNQTLYLIIAALVAFIVGGGAFVLWFIVSEARERRKHYKVTITVKPDGTMGEYKSKPVVLGKEPITVIPRDEMPIADVYVNLLDGSMRVSDMRVPFEG